MGLPERLKKLRKEKGLYQKDVARDIGLTSSAIGFYEQGKRKPDNETLERLADYYDVSVDYLLGRTNERLPAHELKETMAKDPELKDFWEKISQREDLKEVYLKTKDLPQKKVKQIIRIIEAVEGKN